MPHVSNKTKYILQALGLLAAISLFGDVSAAGPTIKCWRNDMGIRECGSYVPPEYSQKRIEILNDRGLVVQVIEPPKTKEQIKAEEEQEQKRKAQEAAQKEQEKQDNILLNSYATERDLVMARDTNISASEADLDIAKSNLKMLESSLDSLQTRAGNYERGGKTPPKNLVDKIQQTKSQISEKKQAIDKRQQEINAMKQRFNKDLTRFRKLKGLSH